VIDIVDDQAGVATMIGAEAVESAGGRDGLPELTFWLAALATSISAPLLLFSLSI
jgi:hypothetical protein